MEKRADYLIFMALAFGAASSVLAIIMVKRNVKFFDSHAGRMKKIFPISAAIYLVSVYAVFFLIDTLVVSFCIYPKGEYVFGATQNGVNFTVVIDRRSMNCKMSIEGREEEAVELPLYSTNIFGNDYVFMLPENVFPFWDRRENHEQWNPVVEISRYGRSPIPKYNRPSWSFMLDRLTGWNFAGEKQAFYDLYVSYGLIRDANDVVDGISFFLSDNNPWEFYSLESFSWELSGSMNENTLTYSVFMRTDGKELYAIYMNREDPTSGRVDMELREGGMVKEQWNIPLSITSREEFARQSKEISGKMRGGEAMLFAEIKIRNQKIRLSKAIATKDALMPRGPGRVENE
jgi:hypothetical protein